MLVADRAAIGRANRMKAAAAFDQERMFAAYAELLGTDSKSLLF
jgi:hypothetical protein